MKPQNLKKLTKISTFSTAKHLQNNPASKKTPIVMCCNRGEIATRVFRAANEHGFMSLGVFSEQDKKSLHRFKCDKSVQLDSSKSAVGQYLDIEGIVKLAKENNVDIVHPGYGFLSENADLANAVEKAGLIFAGPSGDVINLFGDKTASKVLAKKIGVPVAEGSGILPTIEDAKAFSNKIKYPVMVKALFGGGGRGIRVARNEEELIESYERCQSEAKSAFGRDEIFIEKYVETPRHIEVQILCDNEGNVVHLFERDCSVQRRNQKVIEIAPSQTLPDEIRKKVCDDAVKLAKAAKYRNAGTVEFLVDKDNNHYFMECNTRIQVEHTVTEEITGVDLVAAQLQIAQGKTLKELNLTQDKISYRGSAIQLRLTTEDASEDFAPSTGRISSYIAGGGKGIRIDGNGYAGGVISPSYDSLLCKITGRGQSFESAARKLLREIKETKIHGLYTNQNFLTNVLQHPVFLSGDIDTSFIEKHPELFDFKPEMDDETAYLNWLGEFIVNPTPKLQGAGFLTAADSPAKPEIPKNERDVKLTGYKDILNKDGPKGLADAVLKEQKILFTDTTMRDAHQSLLMTRMRTRDILQAAEVTAQTHNDFFSLENWGGATFDVSMRFLHEDPWERLEKMRELIPNIPFQMLLRGANAVGYTSYADNIVDEFCNHAVKKGMDVFRVFDSLNYADNMKFGMDAVGQAGGVIEAAICYTGLRDKYTLEYYVEYGRKLVEHGCHFLALKDMTGLLKPYDAKVLISALKKEFPNTPLHIHMHDNAGSAIASLLACVEAGADIIDLCTDSMSGVTSQGSFGTMQNILSGSPRDPKLRLNQNDYGLDQYWKGVRDVYAPFESPERSCFSDTYQHEMPGGQYTNLQFQAKSMGLGDQWSRVKQCYIDANKALGDIVKVTPSSKVVGDLANFMVTNNLDLKSVNEQAETLNFPKSVLEYLQGQLGQPHGGFPEPFRSKVLKANGLKPLSERPGLSIPPFDFQARKKELVQSHGKKLEINDTDVISSALYPDVFENYCEIRKKYGRLTDLPTEYLLRPLKEGEEIYVELEHKPVYISYNGMGQTDPDTATRKVSFEVNGTNRIISIKDESVKGNIVENEKADSSNPNHIASPIKSQVVDIKVKVGDKIQPNDVVAVLTAMKMEMTVKSSVEGTVARIVQKANANLESGDLIIELK